MSEPRRPATIKDVARRSGVSITTVSRVLNGSAPVIPDTRERVMHAIQELDFVPRPAARMLVNRRTDTIGLLLPEISGAFFQPMLRGIEMGVREAGFDLLIHSTQDAHPETPRRLLGEHNTDGLIIFPGSVDEKELLRLHRVGFPVVLLNQTPSPVFHMPVVTIENKSGAEKIVNHLVKEHGRRRIVFLRGPAGHEDSDWRERGYTLALRANGIDLDERLIGYGGFSAKEGRRTIDTMLAGGMKFDAVFAGDDESASGALAALRQAGLRVPEDVALVGFDDVAFAMHLSPPLTTVRAPIEEVGHTAVLQLVKCIRRQACEPEILLPTELVIRQSCGCV